MRSIAGALGCLVCYTTLVAAQTATGLAGVKSVCIGSLGDKPGAAALREHLAAELEKTHRFRIVANHADADAVLGGSGETWVKEHYSLNPRTRSVGDSQALYAGYLSVELRAKNNEVLWSYLATPHAASGDVERELARLVAKKLAASDSPAPARAERRAAGPMITLNGAGATFPYPVYLKWFDSFHARFPAANVHYDAIGSEAGIARLMEGASDFAASDVRISSEEFFAGGKPKYLRFPTVLGAVVPIYNLAEVRGDLRFTPQILAGIYLGEIRKWNDPLIAEANRGTQLPDRDIAVVHRADGSGSTYVWTDYLTKVSPAWKSAIGASGLPHWPVGTGAPGNEGVAQLVRDTPGSIGYVEYIYAITNHLSYGSVRNAAGRFVSPDLESITAAAQGSPSRIAEDLQTSITNPGGAGAYPIASFSWFVVPATIDDADKKKALRDLLRWVLGPGQNEAAALGYVAIPQQLLERELRLVESF